MAGRKRKMPVRLAVYEGLDLGEALNPAPKMPIRAHSDDAGFDLFVSETVVVPPHGFKDVPSGVSVELPHGYWGLLTGRSSTIRQRGLLVVQGIIDTGYRGELFSAVWNLTSQPVVVTKGDRIAQFIILPNETQNTLLVRSEALGDSERGLGGFGSSGA